MSTCELRPHHALCVGFFRGRGYSETFVENMAVFIGALRTQNPLLTLRSAADPLCRCCIRFGCKVQSYQWSVIEAFTDCAKSALPTSQAK